MRDDENYLVGSLILKVIISSYNNICDVNSRFLWNSVK